MQHRRRPRRQHAGSSQEQAWGLEKKERAKDKERNLAFAGTAHFGPMKLRFENWAYLRDSSQN
jgi:hypothetical protein